MVLVHDLVAAELERAAIEGLGEALPAPTGHHVSDLWHEFEAGPSGEARFARELTGAVIGAGAETLAAAGTDVEAVRASVA